MQTNNYLEHAFPRPHIYIYQYIFCSLSIHIQFLLSFYWPIKNIYFHFNDPCCIGTDPLSVCTRFLVPPRLYTPPRSLGAASFWGGHTPWCQSSDSPRPQEKGEPPCRWHCFSWTSSTAAKNQNHLIISKMTGYNYITDENDTLGQRFGVKCTFINMLFNLNNLNVILNMVDDTKWCLQSW